MRKAVARLILDAASAGLSGADDQCIAQYGLRRLDNCRAISQDAVAHDDRSRVAQVVEFPLRIQVSAKRKRCETISNF